MDVSEERVVEDPYDDWDDAFHHTAFFLRGPLHEEPWLVSKQDDPCHHFPEDDAATTITAALVVSAKAVEGDSLTKSNSLAAEVLCDRINMELTKTTERVRQLLGLQ